MSAETLELAREAIDRLSGYDLSATMARVAAGDDEALAAFAPMLERLDPAVVWDVSALSIPDLEVLHGHEGVISFWVRWMAEWEDYSFQAREFEAIGDHVVYEVTVRGRSRLASAPAELSHAQVLTFRDRRIVAFHAFRDRAAALAFARRQPAWPASTA